LTFLSRYSLDLNGILRALTQVLRKIAQALVRARKNLIGLNLQEGGS
jgi:hypothetical protein